MKLVRMAQHVTPLTCTRKLRPLGAGFEYNLLSEVLQSARDGFELPGQLGVELHRGLKAAKFKSKEPTDAEFARLVGELRRHYELNRQAAKWSKWQGH